MIKVPHRRPTQLGAAHIGAYMIEPKEVTLKSEVHGEERIFRLGMYPATEGIRLLGLFAETVDIAARKKTEDVNGMFGNNLKKAAVEICQYVEVKLINGNWQKLDNEILINVHVLDYELLLRLVREVHDHNSHFFKTGRLLRTSQGLMENLKSLVMKTLNQSLDSLSQKGKRRSKS